MVAVLIGFNGEIKSFELDAYGSWIILPTQAENEFYRSHSWDSCDDFIFRIFIQKTRKQFIKRMEEIEK